MGDKSVKNVKKNQRAWEEACQSQQLYATSQKKEIARQSIEKQALW